MAFNYFTKQNMKHSDFKRALANALVNFGKDGRQTRVPDVSKDVKALLSSHSLVQFGKYKHSKKGQYHRIMKDCYYCKHTYPESRRSQTSYYCAFKDCGNLLLSNFIATVLQRAFNSWHAFKESSKEQTMIYIVLFWYLVIFFQYRWIVNYIILVTLKFYAQEI